MNNNIEKRLNELKISFTKIVDIKNEDINIFEVLELRMIKLKEIYAEFIQNNKTSIFVFGLDSFRFQSKLIDIDHDDMKRLFLAITNRIYCEYFKLFKIIVQYIQENINDKKLLDLINVNDNYPIYKDLEPYKKYDFDVIQNIHEIIITLLNSLNGILINKEHEFKIYKLKNNIGFNIDNFVNTVNYNNIILNEKILLFITYMEFFHKLHHKYFKRFTTKLQLMYSQITHDIKFEDNEETNKTKNNEMLSGLAADDEVDTILLKELKASINDNISDDAGSDFELFENIQLSKTNSLDSQENRIVPKLNLEAIVKQKEAENNIQIEVVDSCIVQEDFKEEKEEIQQNLVVENNSAREVEEDDELSVVTTETIATTIQEPIIKPKRAYKKKIHK